MFPFMKNSISKHPFGCINTLIILRHNIQLRLKCCHVAAGGELLKRRVHLRLAMILNTLLNLCNNIYQTMATKAFV